MNGTQRTAWWRDAVVYQVWPKSFYSSKKKSTGDILGVIAKLDYLKKLGINTVWVSPHYASPMVDEGYDVADYEAINPLFGDVGDTELLIKECHLRGLRIIFDLVVNHTSDQHKWFQESRADKTNLKRDWYIWRPATFDSNGRRRPPNNWSSMFGQSAWTWDESTQEYYLHIFTPQQPDLNWENLEMRKAVYKSAIEFWLKRGVNGFRVDTANMYSKSDLSDAPLMYPGEEYQPAGDIYCNGEQMHEILQEMGAIFKKYDAMTVGETPYTSDKERILDYVSFKRNELSMLFQFDTVNIGKEASHSLMFKSWSLHDLKKIVERWQKFADGSDGWMTTFWENHDQGRSVSRFANDDPKFHAASAKMFSLLTTCSSGTPFIFQGQEIGMTNMPISWNTKEYLDVKTNNVLARAREVVGCEHEFKKVMMDINLHARDNGRTPMQWNAEPNAGFTDPEVKPWMRINDNASHLNAAQQMEDPTSVWNFWQKGLELRNSHPDLFTYGRFELREEGNEKVFAFTKSRHESALYTERVRRQGFGAVKQALILLNFSSYEQDVSESLLQQGLLEVALSSAGVKEPSAKLKAYEGRVIFLKVSGGQ